MQPHTLLLEIMVEIKPPALFIAGSELMVSDLDKKKNSKDLRKLSCGCLAMCSNPQPTLCAEYTVCFVVV